ncbi:DUF262 domain-containing protein [Nicoliella lavandulae]|uniref:DUF262 domain-containing protein n=1 Tax=Nicoliella lavandulae TaxID=3082954 RepID=A0ABU8SJ69_9LACO
MSNYDYKKMSYSKDLSDIKIPKFQRSLVWKKSQKLDLLRTLHKDFPFGALLVTPARGSAREYNLLDGQQRLSTIKDYDENRIDYWKELEPVNYKNDFYKFNQMLKDHDIHKVSEEFFDLILLNQDEFEKWRINFLDEISQEGDGESVPVKFLKTFESINEFLKSARSEINGYIDLEHLEIPVLEFTGNEEDLPEVYENLNKGGVPLNKYEILSASWFDEKIKIPSDYPLGDTILDLVKKYYNRLIQDGVFTISDFSEDEITNSREINLAEFSKALGALVVNNLFALVKPTQNSINEIGFGIMGIITGVDNKKIATIHNQRDFIQDNIKSILDKADRLSKRINSRFSKILKKNISFSGRFNANQDEYAYGLSSTFKILSYFASTWSLDEDDLNITLENIPAYYVFDGINKSWNAHGDTRLFDYYSVKNTRSYLRPLNSRDFKMAFNNWIEDNPNIHQNFNNEVRALITIHSNFTYLANGLPASEDYEFEHVIPKARILENDPEPQVVHAASLGNGMFLPKSLNNKKNNKTLYEFNDDDKFVDYDNLRKESDYFSEAQFTEIFNDLDHKNFTAVNQFIDDRARKMADQIVAGLDPKNELFHQMNPNRNRDHLTRK